MWHFFLFSFVFSFDLYIKTIYILYIGGVLLGKKSNFLVSVPLELHLWLKEISDVKGISVNAYVNLVLSDKKEQEEKKKLSDWAKRSGTLTVGISVVSFWAFSLEFGMVLLQGWTLPKSSTFMGACCQGLRIWLVSFKQPKSAHESAFVFFAGRMGATHPAHAKKQSDHGAFSCW